MISTNEQVAITRILADLQSVKAHPLVIDRDLDRVTVNDRDPETGGGHVPEGSVVVDHGRTRRSAAGEAARGIVKGTAAEIATRTGPGIVIGIDLAIGTETGPGIGTGIGPGIAGALGTTTHETDQGDRAGAADRRETPSRFRIKSTREKSTRSSSLERSYVSKASTGKLMDWSTSRS